MEDEWRQTEEYSPVPEYAEIPEYTPEYPDVSFFRESAVTALSLIHI